MMDTGEHLPWRHVHIVGMGGTGLSALARVLLGMDVDVSGCDRQDGARLQTLAHQGARVWVGHDPSHLEDVDALLISSAVPQEHPEVVAARRLGVPVLKRRDILPHLLAGRDVIGVAGTHGKTTTTGMLVHTLRRAGYDIGYIVGSDLPAWGNADAGREPTFVIEADEYDYMFWGLTPRVAVITNVEWDHVDCFPTRDAYMDAFTTYARSAQVVVACADDEGAMTVAQASGRPVVTYGLRADAMWRAVVVGTSPQGGIRFQPVRAGTQVGPALTLRVPGYHNVLNALAALAALNAAGFSPEDLAHYLTSYEGAGRRFQHVGEVGGVTVIDDYAHHPTEVKATLAAARLAFAGRRVWAVFQPHTYTRTRALLPAWQHAFADADRVLVMDIYAARERDTLGLTGAAVARTIEHPNVAYSGDVEATVAHLRQHVRPGDVVITLGAGTSEQVARALVQTVGKASLSISTQHMETDNTVRLLPYWRDLLEDDVLLQGASLAEYTSMRVGGPADVLAVPTRLDRLVMLVRTAKDAGVPVVVLGGGSNVLIRDGGIRGLVIINRCRRYQVLDGEPPRVWVESGMSLAGLARRLIQEGIGGLTWAVSIPGTVGGAVVGNAGAHGGSMADVVERVMLLHEDGSVENRPGEDMQYTYRSSVLKRRLARGERFPLVLGALLRLQRGDPDVLRQQAEQHLRYRRQTQPTEPSVGSVFRNPPGEYAGRLIEAAGLKGARVGGAMVSPVHANFIINVGGAQAKDVLVLMRLVQERVREMFDVRLEPEILIIGEE